MKKTLSLALLLLCLTTALSAPAMAQTVPAAPSWIDKDEYAVFSDGVAYEAENWEKILSLRAHAEAGNLAPDRSADTLLYNRYQALERISESSVQFELGLLAYKFALNGAARGEKVNMSGDFEMAGYYSKDIPADAHSCYTAFIWNARSKLWNNDLTTGLEGSLPSFIGALEYLLPYEQFALAPILDWGVAVGVPAERLNYVRNMILVTLDGAVVHPKSVRISADYVDYTTAQSRNNRTMVPVRRLAELMGATVGYDAAAKKITICRGADEIVLTLDSTTAYQNGKVFQMDVAPYAEDNRTYVPIRYIAEFFSQSVVWKGEQRRVVITEDKSVADSSNVEDWALAMGALLNYENNPKEAHLFGGKARFGTNPVGTVSDSLNRLQTNGPDFARKILSESWGITDRSSLFRTAGSLCAGSSAWDLFRVSHLAQWGYLSGYVDYREALELVQGAAQTVSKRFSSWESAYEDYLTGYCQWAGLETSNVWLSERGLLYAQMLSDPNIAPLIDDSLFRTGVKPLRS